MCRACDWGRIYCGEDCAAAQRRISVLLARRTYARSPKGKLAHARAEARRRLERKAKIVMNQGLATTKPAPILGQRWSPAWCRRDIGRDIAGERHRQRAPGAARDLEAFVTCI